MITPRLLRVYITGQHLYCRLWVYRRTDIHWGFPEGLLPGPFQFDSESQLNTWVDSNCLFLCFHSPNKLSISAKTSFSTTAGRRVDSWTAWHSWQMPWGGEGRVLSSLAWESVVGLRDVNGAGIHLLNPRWRPKPHPYSIFLYSILARPVSMSFENLKICGRLWCATFSICGLSHEATSYIVLDLYGSRARRVGMFQTGHQGRESRGTAF